ncbi:hypothetical protein QCN29_11205 [Streptomyces sp. HNM0663]|uniref:Uncharacterized protein n=1 Tax=Streptomyces chengmaiensis TaxID=3040919 RepID=A0ABT6HM03_9ACTN|nr:hypothetical protein [Streptomyces chengmaiensis]MDH2389350.1 hypothetical protein [Streptomyces chengmaiensis]
MSAEQGRRNWLNMRPEDFEKSLEPKPAPPGQMQLFPPGPAQPKSRRKPPIEPSAFGTMDLLDLVDPDE